MPHQVIDESNGPGVVISFSGVVSAEELLALNAHLINEVSFATSHYQVWDFSKATHLAISVDDLRSISVQDIHGSAINPRLRIAIVGEPSLFGNLSEIFLMLEEEATAYRPKFFADIEAAKEWASSEYP